MCVCVCVFEIYYSHDGLWPIREKELQARGLAVVEVRLDVLGDPVSNYPLLHYRYHAEQRYRPLVGGLGFAAHLVDGGDCCVPPLLRNSATFEGDVEKGY